MFEDVGRSVAAVGKGGARMTVELQRGIGRGARTITTRVNWEDS